MRVPGYEMRDWRNGMRDILKSRIAGHALRNAVTTKGRQPWNLCILSKAATTLLPEQANPSRSIKRMALRIHQFFLLLARRGSCQAALNRVCKPQAGGSIPLASSWVKT